MRTLPLLVLAAVMPAIHSCREANSQPLAERLPDPARGRHLVMDVALCADCHTPRLPDGTLDEKHPLAGAAIGFKPLVEMPWSAAAPPIAGLPGYTDEEAIRLLTEGVARRGTPAFPPMPVFHFTRDEAADVVAYLRSVTPATP